MDDLALQRRKRRNDLLQKREAGRQQRILEAQRIVPGQAYTTQSSLCIPKQEPPKQGCTKLFSLGASLDGPHAEGPIRYVLASEITKTSPSSSVSMSQSPETRLSAQTDNRGTEKTKKNIFNKEIARPKKRGRILQPDSDSSDDEDLFCFGSKCGGKTVDQPKYDTAAPSQKQKGDPPDGQRIEWIWEDLKSSDNGAREKLQSSETPPTMKKTPHKSLGNDATSSTKILLDEPKPLHSPAMISRIEKSIPKPSRSSAQHLEESPQHLQEVDKQLPSSSATTSNKMIRNPLVEEKFQRQQTNLTLQSAEINACSLWEDSDDNDEDQPSVALTPSNQNRTFVDAEEENIEHLRNILYPSFERPKFFSEGPPVPLVFNDSYEVPASINRYLGEYQRVGSKFMFDKAVAIQRGCILGDDMGLGKTVQTIALIAALLKKTGTEYDKSVLHRRRVQADERSRRVQFEKEKCLKAGRPYYNNETYGDVARELGLSEMAPIMVVAPKAVVSSWEETLMKWGHFAVVVYDGNRKRRELTIKGVENGIYEVVIVAYPTFQDQEKTAALKNGLISWKIIFIDEMHYCKNAKAELTKNIRGFRDVHKSIVIGLTGTVMPNEHKELWNLIDLAAPNYLGKWSQFQDNFSIPMKLSRQRKATEIAIEFGQKQKLRLDKLLQDVLLRRDKNEILADKLPQKNECIVFCELSEMQALVYRHILAHTDYDTLMKSNAPCDCGVNKKIFLMYQQLRSKREKLMFLRKWRKQIKSRGRCCFRQPGTSNQPSVLWPKQHPNNELCLFCPKCILLPALSVLAKLCSHLSLLQVKEDPQSCIEGSAAYVKADLELKMAKAFLPKDVAERMSGGYVRDSSILNHHCDLSGKFRYLGKILDRIERQNEKVLVFSNYTVPLDLIENYLESKGYASLRIDGSTCTSRRQDIIAEFGKMTGAFILLLSKKAMGVGVTLTEANNVILFDVDWSPANDSQAQDRSYRIGQDRTVFVYRLVAKGTVEEMKYLRQLYKKDMTSTTLDEGVGDEAQRGQFRGVQKDKTRKGELFGLENLLKYKEDTFMNYKRNAALSQSHGFDLYDVGEILETMKATNANDEVLPFDDEAAVLEGFEQYRTDRTESVEHEEVDDEDDEAHLGMESQAAMDLLDEADPIQETADQDVNSVSAAILSALEFQSTASMPSTGSPPVSNAQSATPKFCPQVETSSATQAMPDNAPSGRLPTISTSDITTKAPPKNEESQVASPVKSFVRSAPSSGASPVELKPEISTNGNLTLVGKTTAAIRRGETGKTSFSRGDLPLPGKANRKKG